MPNKSVIPNCHDKIIIKMDMNQATEQQLQNWASMKKCGILTAAGLKINSEYIFKKELNMTSIRNTLQG